MDNNIRRDLPFCFGCEIEIMIRSRSSSGLQLPHKGFSASQQRRYNFRLLEVIARALTDNGLACQVFDPAEQDCPDYTVWNAMLDASLSRAHLCDGFCEKHTAFQHESDIGF